VKLRILALLLLAAAPAALAAQEPTPPDTAAGRRPAAQDTVERRGPSPAGAFARSLIVPGWGQLAVGAPVRGGVYFAIAGGSWYGLLRTDARLRDVRDREDRLAADVRAALRLEIDSLLATGIPDDSTHALALETADSVRARVAADPGVAHARALVESRSEQREDWIAWTIFWTLANAADAYVSAHLADFPLRFSALPRREGGVVLRMTLPVGPRRP